MRRWDIINLLTQKHNYCSYLEIGVQNSISNGASFLNVSVPYKVGVDPDPVLGNVTFRGTSDEYFEQLNSSKLFDIIFIDGLHHSDQVLRDIHNSLQHLSENGTIVVHDCLPFEFQMQLRDDPGGIWTGDVWKAIAELRMTVTNLEIHVVDTDLGCGIIRRGTNIPYIGNDDCLQYSYYEVHKNELMNIISTEDFLNYYIRG